MWQDTEDLASEVAAVEEAQRDQIRQLQSMTGCGSHDKSAERRVANLTFKDRMMEMGAFMEQGNALYDEGQYGRAVHKYKRVMVYYEYGFPETDSEERAADAVRLHALTNTAACLLKIGEYGEGIESCKQALRMEEDNVKTLYRRAVMYRKRDEFEKARADIGRAIELDPGDKTLRAERVKLR
jgi:FK506-binding protein 4/5